METETRTTDMVHAPAQPEADREPLNDTPRETDDRLSTADVAAASRPRSEPAQPPASPGPEPAANGTVGNGRASGGDASTSRTPLFDPDRAGELRTRWDDVQASFVDEPRSSVQDADALVAEVMQQLAQTFARERQSLEEQWSKGDDVSTEELRIALQRYRSFFGRLLSL